MDQERRGEQEIKEESLEILKDLLNNYQDEIPVEIVHTGPFKVRGNWFNGVFPHCRLAVRRGWVTDQNLIKEFEIFSEDYVTRKRATEEFMTKKEDIEKANSILTRVIETMDR